MSYADDVARIIAVVNRYALSIDRYDPDVVLSVFTSDATLDHSPCGYPKSVGHDEIAEYFAPRKTRVRRSMHFMSNHLVDITGPDSATGSSYVHAIGPGPDGGAPVTAALAINEDVYRRTTDGWKIAHRVTSPMVDIGREA